jgi:hypothetical protein
MVYRSKIEKAIFDRIHNIEGVELRFKTEFLSSVGIDKKRFGYLVKGEKEPTSSEIRALSEILKVELSDLI